ncbi:MAG: hypothetical protein IJF83_10955 [Methanobrevibacter sp.]|nr:hypothetical protein [Methanobrevibacter sp.]
MSILINRFEAIVCKKGIHFKIDNKGIVVIKDHSNDKIIGMVSLNFDSDKNKELAEKVIETIEEFITDTNED